MNVLNFIRFLSARGRSFDEIAVALNRRNALPHRRRWTARRVQRYPAY